MKHKYILVPDVECLTENTIVYYVWVGISAKDLRLLRQLERYAAMNNMWFELWGDHVVQRLAYYNSKVFHFDGYFMNRFRVVSENISVVAPIFIGANRDIFESNLNDSQGRFKFICGLFHVPERIENFIGKRTLALCQKRKYLSTDIKQNLSDTAVKIGLIISLIALGAWLENIEPYWY